MISCSIYTFSERLVFMLFAASTGPVCVLGAVGIAGLPVKLAVELL